MIEKKLTEIVYKFNTKIKESDDLKDALRDIEKYISIEITDEKAYYYILKDSFLQITNHLEKIDVTISCDSKTFIALINKEISPTSAYFQGKLKVKGSIFDLIMLKDLFKY